MKRNKLFQMNKTFLAFLYNYRTICITEQREARISRLNAF